MVEYSRSAHPDYSSRSANEASGNMRAALALEEHPPVDNSHSTPDPPADTAHGAIVTAGMTHPGLTHLIPLRLL